MTEEKEYKEGPGSHFLVTAFAMLFVASFLAFGASTKFPFLEFDDSYLVANNLAIRGPTLANLKTVFTSYDPELYIPVTLVSYQFNYLVAGLSPGFYHFTNILLHAINATLVSGIALAVLRSRGTALLLGLLFALHPLNTEAVAWVSGRKDLLSTAFLLGSILLWLQHRESRMKNDEKLSIVFYALAALSKSSVIVLPLLLPLLSLLQTGETQTKKDMRKLWPYFFIAIVTGLIALGGKTRVIGGLTVMETLLLAGKSTAFYLTKIFIPLDLSAIYPQSNPIALSSPDIWIPLAVLTAIAAICVLFWKKTHWPLACFFLFILTIAPSFLNAHKGTQTFFAVDRYAYVAMIWILLLLGAVLLSLPEKLRTLAGAGFLFVTFAFGVLSHAQTALWASDGSILEHALKHYPASVSARTGLSSIYRNQGKFAEEKKVLEDGLAYSDDTALWLGIASIKARAGEGSAAEAIERERMRKDPLNPEPHFYLGSLYESQGKTEEAKAEYAKAISMDTSYVAARANLGAIELDAGNYASAREQFEEALRWNPNFFEGHYNLFLTLEYMKKKDAAFPHLKAAYALRSDIADVAVAYAYRLHERKRDAEAKNVLKTLLSENPENRTAKRLLEEVVNPSLR